MNTVDAKEIQNFSKDAAKWWDVHGPFAPLHRLNGTRLKYLRGQIDAHYGCDPKDLNPYKKLSILDIGCGGGLVCEPMCRLGATVTGIDADKEAIAAATAHAAQSGLAIDYRAVTTADIKTRFDVVLALEVIEHVSDTDQFMKEVAALVKPGGLVIVSTLNRTAKSYALGIVAAEYILRWVSPGTHNWKKFLKPSEVSRLMRAQGLTPKNIQGMVYHPLNKEFVLSDRDTDVNYFIAGSAAIGG